MTPLKTSPYKILFLCTGNTARSVLAEFLMKRIGQGKFEAYSAGSFPKGTVNPLTLRVLKELYKIDASDARSKSWEEFTEQSMEFDFVITVCDNAKESCPVWPGQPIVAHWGSPDPAEATGSEEEKFTVFKKVALQIQRRIDLFTSLPLEKLDHLRLAEMVKGIGQRDDE